MYYMKKKKSTPECKRCGACCFANMIAYVTDEDMARWRDEGRDDILHLIKAENAVWMGDHLVSASTGKQLNGCPFLVVQDGACACAIYETRPLVCMEYQPGESELCPLYKKDFT